MTTTPLVLSIANLKGGVGKSTLSLNLASTLHRAGHRVLIVDTDTQGTCRSWAAVAGEANHAGAPVVSLEGRALRRDLPHVAAGYDVAIVDTAPRLGAEVRAALMVADLVLLPVVPGAADVWALRETLAVVSEARELRPDLRVGLVLNRAERTTLTEVARAAVDKLAKELGAPVLGSLGNRVAFGEATARGLGVVAYAPESKAAAELEHLVAAILAAAGRPAKPKSAKTKPMRKTAKTPKNTEIRSAR